MSNALVVDMQEFCQVVDMPVAYVIEHGIVERPRRKAGAVAVRHLFAFGRQARGQAASRPGNGVALALDLLEELEQVRSENRMLKQRQGRFVED